MTTPVGQEDEHVYPEPFISHPQSSQHEQSFIILHGRGSNGELFGRQLLQTPVPGWASLQHAFPNAKFIFPSAAPRRVEQLSDGSRVPQWFDIWSIKRQTEREELQFDGLRESCTHINNLLAAEIAAVGAKNVILWGLSQGCSTALITMLLWQGEAFAATIGMCGWLPLRERLTKACLQLEDPRLQLDEVIAHLRRILGMSSNPSTTMTPATLTTPVFMSHGTMDDTVPVALAHEVVDLWRSLGLNVDYHEYETLRHWYSGQMLRDIVSFIEHSAEWEVNVVVPKVDETTVGAKEDQERDRKVTSVPVPKWKRLFRRRT